MSSFSDNFKRDSEEDMLEYDDSAFYYFSISILTAVLLPFTWNLMKSMIWGDTVIENSKDSDPTFLKALIALKKREAKSKVYTTSFYFRIMVCAFFWYLWYLNAEMVNSMEQLQSFDPFMILQVPSDASVKDIKKQYRRMSLEMHPDKNPDNPLAVQEFIRLTKAYNILTDATAFENF